MKQADFQFEPHKMARRTDPDTSHAAAKSMEHSRVGHMNAILNALSEPLTAEQIADKISLDYVAVNRRLPEMERAKVVFRTDERRKNRSGRKAIVWNRFA